jgi:hypothetical protein
MNKSNLITWLASLSDDDPSLAAVEKIQRGELPKSASQTIGRSFSITETARVAGISRQSVHAALRAGALVASPLYAGGRRRVREHDLRRWLEGRAA